MTSPGELSQTDIKGYEQRQVEHGFVASCMVLPIQAVTNCGWLDPTVLSDRSARKYWEHLLANVTPGMSDKEAEEVSAQAAVQSDAFDELIRWQDLLFYGATPQAFAGEIIRRRYVRDVSPYVAKLAHFVSESDIESIHQTIRDLSGLSVGVTQDDNSTSATQASFEQAVTSGDRALSTGIGVVDRAIGGLERQSEIVLAARPSMGKTALGFQVARNALAMKKRVAFFSIEMSKASLWARAVCPIVGVTWRDVIAGQITPEQRQMLIDEGRKLSEKYLDYLYLDDRSQTTDTIWRAVAGFNPDLVVVDHLRLVGDRGDNEVKRQGLICERFKAMAKAFDLPVLIIAQLNRGLENRVDKRPTMSDLRDSGEIEEHADLVLMIYSDAYYANARKPDLVPTELWVRKFRNGPANVLIDLLFDSAQEWFLPVGAVN